MIYYVTNRHVDCIYMYICIYGYLLINKFDDKEIDTIAKYEYIVC